MSKFLSNRSIVFVFVSIFVAVTVLVVLGTIIVFQYQLSHIIITEKTDYNTVIAKNTRDYIENRLELEVNVIRGIGNSLSHIEMMSDVEKTNYFDSVKNDSEYLLNIELLDSEYTVYESYPERAYREGYDLSNFISNYKLGASTEYIWTKPYSTPDIDEIVISLIFNTEEGYIFATYTLDVLDDIYQNLIETTPDKHIIITDRYGIFVYDSTGPREIQRMKFEGHEEIIRMYSQGNDSEIVIDGELSIAATERVVSQGWFVTIYESRSNALNIFIEITAIVLITIVGIVIVYMFGILHSMSIVRSSIKKLYQSMVKVTSGDYNHRLNDIRFKEFLEIREEFNEMSESLSIQTTRLENLAYYDQLTGLRSRTYLNEFYRNIESNTDFAVLYVDMNRFQVINDTYGYEFGSKLIIEFSGRLKKIPIEGIEVFKSEGDEFIVVIQNKTIRSNAEDIVNYIISSMTKPYVISGVEVLISIKVGIVHYSNMEDTIETLVTKAIIAMNDSKLDPDKEYAFFSEKNLDIYNRKLEIELSIDKGLDNNEFYIDYQPVVLTDSKNIRGVEALSRWEHGRLGLIGPVEYVPILERAKKIHLLDEYVLSNGVSQISDFMKQYNQELVLSVNVSVDTLLRPQFTKRVKLILDKYNFDPNLLELEVTESTIISDYNQVRLIISELRKLGVRFSEDDFGDGFSALNYLTKLDLSTLKISRNLTETLDSDESTKVLVTYIIDLAKSLNLDTIIEGVETEQTYKICKDIKCTYIQGYYFYRPMRLAQLEKIYNKKRTQ